MPKNETDAARAAADAIESLDGTTTHLIVLGDESGSMKGNEEAVVTGINEFIAKFRDRPKTRFTLAWFDMHPGADRTRVLIDDQRMEATGVIEIGDYRPRGRTPLNDAIADMLSRTEGRVKKGDKALFIIFTDGYENASELSVEECKAMIEKYEAREEWAFLYLGANQNAQAVATSYGLGATGQSMAFTSSPVGTQAMAGYVGEMGAMRMASPTKADYEKLAADAARRTGGKIPETEKKDPDKEFGSKRRKVRDTPQA